MKTTLLRRIPTYMITVAMFAACQAAPNNDCSNSASYGGGTSTQQNDFSVGIIAWNKDSTEADAKPNQYCVAYVHDHSKVAMGAEDKQSFNTRVGSDVIVPDFTIASAKACLALMKKHQESAALYLATDFSALKERLKQKATNPLDPKYTSLQQELNATTIKISLNGNLQASHILESTSETGVSETTENTKFHYDEIGEVGIKFSGENSLYQRFFMKRVGFLGMNFEDTIKDLEGAFVSEKGNEQKTDNTLKDTDWKAWDQILAGLIYRTNINNAIAAGLWNVLSSKVKTEAQRLPKITHLYGMNASGSSKNLVDKATATVTPEVLSQARPEGTGHEGLSRKEKTADNPESGQNNTNLQNQNTPTYKDWNVSANTPLLPGSFVMVNHRVVAAMRAAHVKAKLKKIASDTDPILTRLAGAQDLTFDSSSIATGIINPSGTQTYQDGSFGSSILHKIIDLSGTIYLTQLQMQQMQKTKDKDKTQREETGGGDKDDDCTSEQCKAQKRRADTAEATNTSLQARIATLEQHQNNADARAAAAAAAAAKNCNEDQ